MHMNRLVYRRLQHIVSVVLALLLGAIFPIIGIAGTVTLLPSSPKQGGTLTIEYTPLESDAAMIEAGNVHAVVYLFSIDQEGAVAVEVPLERKSGRWTGSTELPRESVYGMVTVGNGRDYDRNKDLFWEFLVSADGTRHVEGANMKAAMARFGQLPEQYRMKEDLEDAIEYLDAEARLYPKNILAQLNYIMIAKAINRLDDREALDKYRELTSSVMQISTPIQALALYQSYLAQEKSAEATSVMEEATRRFPTSLAAEQGSLRKLSESKSLEDFIGNVQAHLRMFPSSSVRQNIIDAVVQGATKQGAFGSLIAFLDQTPTVSAMTYYRTVNVLGSVDSLRPEALRLIDNGLKASKDAARKPRDVGQSAWNEEQRIARSLLLFIKGAIERIQSRNDDAIASLEQSISIGGADAEKMSVQMLIELYRSAGKSSKALTLAENALSSGNSNQSILDAYRQLLTEDGKDSSEVATEEAKLRATGRRAMAKRMQGEFLNIPAIDGTFTRLDGSPVKISDWKGKVVIIDYWATWCGPCRQSFPSLQKLYERYRNNPNVIIAVVNVWERSEDRVQTVKDFLAKNTSLTFPMYLDKTDAVVGNYGVTGIPTKFYLGKDGRIQFKEVGLHPEEQFLEEATMRIEALLNQ